MNGAPLRSGFCRVVGAAAALLLVAGCASLPDSGAVHSGVGASPSTSAAPFDFNPPGPQQGASRREIVAGFLRALQATPVSTRSAAEFLTPKAAAGWHPQQRTLVYRSQVTRLTPTGVSVHLRRAFGLDETGRWTGTLRGDQRAVEMGVTRTDGEWRISSLPDATVIPSTHFERRYREYSLYFFDTSARVLVPELVYLPWGVQTPTLLVSGLLAGPTGTARRVERSYFPPDTRLGVSVPVGPNGTAQVPLSREVLRLDSSRMDRVLAQLTWTLRQTDNVARVQILVDGNPVELPGGGTTVNVMDYGEFSPAIASASTDLFGVRGPRVVQDVGAEEITAANLPAQDRAPRSMGVEMSGQRFAVVSADGGRVDVLGRTGAGSHPAATVYTGTDLLRPMWDHTDRLWLVDLRHSGPEVLVGKPDQLTRLAFPNVAGIVQAASLSRDGTRLAFAVRRGNATVVLQTRVVRRSDGTPTGFTRFQVLPSEHGLRDVRGIAWRDPATVAVLTRPSTRTSGIELVSCDGSSRLINLTPPVDVLFDRGTSLAASPGGPLALAVATVAGRTYELDPEGRWELGSVREGLALPTYVG